MESFDQQPSSYLTPQKKSINPIHIKRCTVNAGSVGWITRWNKSSYQAWMEMGWKHSTMARSARPTCPPSSPTRLHWQEKRLSCFTDFIAGDFDSIVSVLHFTDMMCVSELKGTLFFSFVLCFVCVWGGGAQLSCISRCFLYEWRVSYWDYISSFWMNYLVCEKKWCVVPSPDCAAQPPNSTRWAWMNRNAVWYIETVLSAAARAAVKNQYGKIVPWRWWMDAQL